MPRALAAIPRPAGACLLVVALILAGCSSPGSGSPAGGGSPSQAGGGNGASPGTSLTACEIVTPVDIETALGLDPGAAAEGRYVENPSEDEPYANECSYLAQAWGGMSVQVLPSFGLTYYGSLVSDLGDRAEAVDVGDGGLWVGDIERGYFLKGSVMVIVIITRLVEPTPLREATIALGEAAVAKLS